MEHRWSLRKPVMGNVVVESPRLGKVRATLLDISLGGLLVDTDSVTLPLNAPVSVAFTLIPNDHRGDYRLQAMTVRQFQGAAGLMFQDLDIETIRALRKLLYSSDSAPDDTRSSRAA